jgi:hypothetical protein
MFPVVSILILLNQPVTSTRWTTRFRLFHALSIFFTCLKLHVFATDGIGLNMVDMTVMRVVDRVSTIHLNTIR